MSRAEAKAELAQQSIAELLAEIVLELRELNDAILDLDRSIDRVEQAASGNYR